MSLEQLRLEGEALQKLANFSVDTLWGPKALSTEFKSFLRESRKDAQDIVAYRALQFRDAPKIAFAIFEVDACSYLHGFNARTRCLRKVGQVSVSQRRITRISFLV